VRPVHSGLLIDPCIPAEWEQVQVVRRFRGATYHIRIENPDKQTGVVKEIIVNGEKIKGNIVPLQGLDQYEVRVVLKK